MKRKLKLILIMPIKIDQFRDSAVTISNAYNNLFIHPNIFDNKDHNIDLQSNLNNPNIFLQ